MKTYFILFILSTSSLFAQSCLEFKNDLHIQCKLDQLEFCSDEMAIAQFQLTQKCMESTTNPLDIINCTGDKINCVVVSPTELTMGDCEYLSQIGAATLLNDKQKKACQL